MSPLFEQLSDTSKADKIDPADAANRMDWSNHTGFIRLICAAKFPNGISDQATFYYVFNQNEQFLTAEERAAVFRVLGSSHILQGNFQEGLEWWETAFSYSPTIPALPSDVIPPITSKIVGPEWTDFGHLSKDISTKELTWELIIKHYDCDEKKLSLLYQAMLIRFRYCREESRSDVWTICEFIRTLSIDSETFVKFAIFLFEWDELYGGHSLSLEHEDVCDVFLHLTSAVTSRNERYINVDFNDHYEHIMVALEWLTTEFIRASRRSDDIHPENLKYFDAAMKSLNSIVITLSELWISTEQEAKYRRCLRNFISADWRNAEGRNLLLENCKWLGINGSAGLYANNIRNVVELLLEEGADAVNDSDNEGNTCLNHMMDNMTVLVLSLSKLDLAPSWPAKLPQGHQYQGSKPTGRNSPTEADNNRLIDSDSIKYCVF